MKSSSLWGQPRDPMAAACAAYCRFRNADMPERDRCPGEGDCAGCRETVSKILRAYNDAAHHQMMKGKSP